MGVLRESKYFGLEIKLPGYIKLIGIVPLILLFLHLLNPFNLAHIFGYLLIGFYVVFRKKDLVHHLDSDVLFLFLFSVSYSLINIFGENKGIQYLFIQTFFPMMFYLIGKHLLLSKLSGKAILYLFLFLGVSYSLTALISVNAVLLKDGFSVSILDRNVPLIWTGERLPATGMSALLIYNMLLPGLIIFNKSTLKPLGVIILLLIFIVSMLCNFRLGSRTGVVICVITLLLSLFYLALNQSITIRIKLIFQIVVVILLVIYFIPIDMDSDYLSVLGERLKESRVQSSSSAGGRTELWEKSLTNLFKHPLGWKSNKYGHNMWLDIAMTTGMIPFFLLIVFNIKNIVVLKRIFFHIDSDYTVKSVFVLFTITSFLQFLVEPIYQGSFFLFSLFCLFQGMIKKYWDDIRDSKAPVRDL